MNNSIVLRRGRCGRLFTKYIQKSIFEESEGNSDGEEDVINNEKKSIKKRRKRYLDLFEYLKIDGQPGENLIVKGILLRDQKYLRKNMQKVSQLSVKESAMKLIKKSDSHNAPGPKLNPFSSSNTELKLDFQHSINSMINEVANGSTGGATSTNPEVAN